MGKKGERNIANDKSKKTFIERHRPEHKLVILTEDHLYCKGGLQIAFSNYLKEYDFKFEDIEIRDDVSEKEACLFLDLFHYKERSRAAPGYKIGAYLKNKLIALSVYATASRQEVATSEGLKFKEALELSRFCIHPGYHKNNFASWMLAISRKKVKEKYPYVRAIITFADTTMDHDGTIYKASGFEFCHETAPDYHYINNETGAFMHKRTLWGIASKLRVQESVYAQNHNFKKVWGSKKLKFIYWLK